MTIDECWTAAELRAFLKLDKKSQDRTWYRVQPFFAGALIPMPRLKRYSAAKVRALLEGARRPDSPMRRHSSLRQAS